MSRTKAVANKSKTVVIELCNRLEEELNLAITNEQLAEAKAYRLRKRIDELENQKEQNLQKVKREVRELMEKEAVLLGHAEWTANTTTGEPVFSWKNCK